MRVKFFLLSFIFPFYLFCQTADTIPVNSVEKDRSLRFDLNKSGSHYLQATFLNQTWIRYTENNPGTTRFSRNEQSTFDIGLRRTRIQLFGNVTDRAFIYFQFGQNNFNSNYNYTGNRKFAAFFHDALCEYKISKGNQLKIGAGLTIMNGLSRFSQPGIGSIMTLDVPVFLQYSVDQIDQFDRRLAVYARGQLKRLDYRFYISNPFPVSSSGNTPPPLSENSNFVNVAALPDGSGPGIKNQVGTYLAYNFFESEAHTTPYMAGTHLGSKKILSLAIGGVYQQRAMWRLGTPLGDTSYADMMLMNIEVFLDMPLNTSKNSAINVFAGFYNTDYGKNYLRYNGSMNPGTGSRATNLVQSNAIGNAYPMFGTGNVIYAQAGTLLPKNFLAIRTGQFMPYVSTQIANYEALQAQQMLVWHAGLNWLISGHSSKLSIDYESRPTFFRGANNEISAGPRKGCVVLQYQILLQ